MIKAVNKVLEDLVSLKSINPPGAEEPVCQYIQTYFQELEIEVTLQEVEPGRHNLLARLPGKSSDALLFTGHMDVVPVSPAEAERWRTDPFKPVVADGRLYGRGTSDMKSGLAAIMTTMTNLKTSGFVPAHDILLAATVDEEFYMRGSEVMMKLGLPQPIRGIIVCEPTGLSLCTAGRGRTFGRITFWGATAHGSKLGGGTNAIDLAVAFINEMKQTDFSGFSTPEYGQSFWQALSIEAGVEPGVIPDQCTLGIDARLTIGHLPQGIWQEVTLILKKLSLNYPDLRYSVTIDDEREPWLTSPSDPLVRQMSDALTTCAIPVQYETFSGTTDGTKLKRGGAPCIIIGPGDLSLVHRENESVALVEVAKAVKLYQEFITSFQ
ncbi:MAG: M20 family metallopeptidase [Clostridiaceae bacterium]